MKPNHVQCVFATKISKPKNEWQLWLKDINIPESGVHNFVVEASNEIPVQFVEVLRKKISNDYGELFSKFFSSKEYMSSRFVVSLTKNAALLPNGIMVVELDKGPVCISETIGHSLSMSISLETDSVCVQKPAGSTDIMIGYENITVVSEQPNVLNIILSSINNYGHFHVHNIPFCIWLRDNLPEIINELGASSVIIWWPHPNGGSGHKEHVRFLLESVVNVEVRDPASLKSAALIENAVICSTFNLDDGALWPKYFRYAFSSLRLPVDPEAPMRIYCNRSHAGSRGIENENELQLALEQIGFTIVECGQLSYYEQRRIFSNASVIIASHGGALTNMVYSHNSPTIIELTHPYYGPIQYGWFQNLASVMGYKYATYISTVPEHFRDNGYSGTYFYVDVDEFLGLLRELELD